nr:F-box/kelch-repeat protein SKIP25-like [Ipomoea batatas]
MAPNLIPQMTNPITATIAEAITEASSAVKRRKNEHIHRDLIPGLPDHIAQTCLSSVHPSLLYSVCHSWRRLIYSPSFPPFLSIYAVFSSSDSVGFASFDPISSAWQFLPLPPPTAGLLLSHPSFISRRLPVQSVAVAGNLVLLAATADKFLPALSRPLIFNPFTRKWTCGPPLSTPRRWCAAGVSGGAVYVASGIGSHYNHKVARSVEKWDLKSNDHRYFRWEKMGCLRDGKFSRDAIDAVGWRGKLCMVNVTGDAAKEGIIYDVKSDAWEEMPAGMLMGWRGPAAALDEETIYMVDESKGALKRYEPERDVWVEVTENQMLKGAQHITAGGGRVCVSCGGGEGIAVFDVVANPPSNMWVVDTPPGFQVLSVHILPRMSQNHFHPSD